MIYVIQVCTQLSSKAAYKPKLEKVSAYSWFYFNYFFMMRAHMDVKLVKKKKLSNAVAGCRNFLAVLTVSSLQTPMSIQLSCCSL